MAEVTVTVGQAGSGGVTGVPAGDGNGGAAAAAAVPKKANSAAGLGVAVEAEHTAYIVGAATTAVRAVVSLTTPAPATAAESGPDDDSSRAPVSLSLVLDKSGSMSGEKIALVKATTDFIITQMSSRDSVGIVAYDAQVDEVMPLIACNSKVKDKARKEVQRIHSGSTTNLSGGLFKGVDQQLATLKGAPALGFPLENDEGETTTELTPSPSRWWPSRWCCPRSSSSREKTSVYSVKSGDGDQSMEPAADGTVHAVFLMTDGQANVGVTDQATLTTILGKMLQQSGGQVHVHTFGFGSDHSETLLNAISQTGGGDYAYLEKEEAIPAVFAEALGGLMSMQVQNLEVMLQPEGGVNITAIRTDYKQEKLGNGAVKLHIGDLYAEERRDLVIEMELPPCHKDAAQPVLRVSAKFLDVKSAAIVEETAFLLVQRAEKLTADQQVASDFVRFQCARVDTAAAIKHAQGLADGGNLKDGKTELENALAKLQKLNLAGEEFEEDITALKSDVNQVMDKFSDEHTYLAVGKKRAFMMSERYFKQRGHTAFQESEGCCMMQQQTNFTTSAQRAMKSKAFNSLQRPE